MGVDLGVPTGHVVLIAAALLVGAVVQGVVGLGLGLVTTPVVALVEPSLLPGLLLLLAAVLPMFTLLRERVDADLAGLGWALPPRVLGTAVGVWLVAVASDRLLAFGVGLMVLASVLLTARELTVPITRSSLVTAGFVSGVTGTTTSIGGPPLALLYQHRPAPEVRATMAVYFLVGAGLSLVGLGLSGELTRVELQVAAVLVPVLAVGATVAVPLRRRLRGDRFRTAVLVLCGVSAVVLLVRSALG